MHPYFRFYYDRLLTGMVILGIILLVRLIMAVLNQLTRELL